MRFALLLAALLVTPIKAACWAQDPALVEPGIGILAHSPSIQSIRASTACPPWLGEHRDDLTVEMPKDSTRATCSVEDVRRLDDAFGLEWRVVKHLTRYIYPADSLARRFAPGTATDTTDVLDVVIYSAKRGDSLWRAEWRGWAEWRMVRDVVVSLGVHDGMALFSIVSCVNGTGGCDQHFVARAGQNWVPLKESYRTELQRRFSGNPFWKGIVVDVHTLRGGVPLYSSNDANCCPSRQLRLALAIRGPDIVVRSAEPTSSR